jgi:NitT/TauT family transport system substrate-binding protein
MKRGTIILLFFAFSVCNAQTGNKLIVCPQWSPQSQFAGIYIAHQKGYYKELGLDVVVKHPSLSNSAINLLNEGEVDIITSQLSQALIALDSGIDLVNILQTSMKNSLMIVSREPIETVEDLTNKKIGRWKSGFYEIAQIMTLEKGIAVQWVPFIGNIALYVSGAIDASLVMSYNEYFQILLSGNIVNDNQIIKFSDIGYNIPEDGFYTTNDFYQEHKELLKLFVKATIRGWNWLRDEDNREEGLDIVMSVMKKNNIAADRVLQKWMLDETLNLQENREGVAEFVLDKDIFDFTVKKLYDNLFIIEEVEYDRFYHNLMGK